MNVPEQGNERAARPLGWLTPSPLMVLVLLFSSAFLFGGSSSTVSNLALWLLMLGAGGALAYFIMTPADAQAPIPQTIIWLACAMLALAACHILPLPPGVWTTLPGRALERDILDFAGYPTQWMPLSLRPLDSMKALLSIVPAFAVFLGLTRIRISQIPIFLSWALGAIGVSALIGALQVSTAGAALTFYDTRHAGFFLGIFSNRNHQAGALLFGYLIAFHLIGRLGNGQLRLALHLGLACLLALFIAASGSRSGALLALLAVPATFFLSPDIRAATRHRAVAGSLVLGMAAIAAIILLSPPGQRILSRFAGSLAVEHRFEYWRVAKPLLAQYWTIGAGFGAFPALYMTIEPMSVLRMRFVNAAHNDYLQLAIEGGLPACLLLGAFILITARAAFRLASAPRRGSARLALLMLFYVLAVMVHSLVDYPLRTVSLACTWAAAVAIFYRMAGLAEECHAK